MTWTSLVQISKSQRDSKIEWREDVILNMDILSHSQQQVEKTLTISAFLLYNKMDAKSLLRIQLSHSKVFYLLFQAQKNDIIDIIVSEVQEEYIKGKIGHAEVMIPQAKIDNLCQYKKIQNIYVISDNNMNVRIQRGSKVRCKCFQVKIQMNFQMKIMASIDRNLIAHFPY